MKREEEGKEKQNKNMKIEKRRSGGGGEDVVGR
jgi:hypothetical protein